MRITPAILALAVCGGCLTGIDEAAIGQAIGEALGPVLADAVVTSQRLHAGDPGELQFGLGDPGFLPSLPSVGLQHHYYGPATDRTAIGGTIAIGDEFLPCLLGFYEGPPRDDVMRSELAIAEMEFAYVVVRVLDKDGRQPYRFSVRAKSVRTRSGSKSDGTRWARGDEARLLKSAGTYRITSPGCEAGWIDLRPGEMAWCTLGPDGLVVDARATRWQSMLREWFP